MVMMLSDARREEKGADRLSQIAERGWPCLLVGPVPLRGGRNCGCDSELGWTGARDTAHGNREERSGCVLVRALNLREVRQGRRERRRGEPSLRLCGDVRAQRPTVPCGGRRLGGAQATCRASRSTREMRSCIEGPFLSLTCRLGEAVEVPAQAGGRCRRPLRRAASGMSRMIGGGACEGSSQGSHKMRKASVIALSYRWDGRRGTYVGV